VPDPPPVFDALPEQYFAGILAAAAEARARPGPPLIDLGRGNPDLPPPAHAIEALRAAAADTSVAVHGYPPFSGLADLRAAIAEHYAREHGIALDPDREVVVTTGCTEGIAAALLGLVNPGDEVVVLEPYYDSYVAMLQMAGGVRRPVTLRAPDFRLDLDELRAAVSDRTRFVLVNTPHNPTGTVLTRDELAAVAELAVERDLVVITDEVYEHLTYTGYEHVPMATLPGMAERTLTLSSAGKSYSFTGWKVGWATGPAELVGALLSAKQWLTFTSGSPLQPAVAAALDERPDFPATLAAELEGKRDLLCTGLEKVGLPGRPPAGTYFATSDITHLGWPDAMAFCLALPERAGVVAIPTQPFYDDPDAGRQLIRWAFCKQTSVIEEALSRLAGADLAYG